MELPSRNFCYHPWDGSVPGPVSNARPTAKPAPMLERASAIAAMTAAGVQSSSRYPWVLGVRVLRE